MQRRFKTAFSPLLVIAVCVAAPCQAWQETDNPPDKMQYPLAVAAAPDGVLYIADRNLPGVWAVKEGKLSLFFRAQKTFRTPLNAIRCLAVDKEGKLLAGDSATRAIYRFDEDGQPTKLTQGKFGIGIPMALAVNGKGEILAADLELHRIYKTPAAGGEPQVVAEVPAPRGLFVDEKDRVWVVSHGKDQVLRLAAEGKPEVIVAGRPFAFPQHLVVDADGALFVADNYSKAIWKVAEDGKPEKWVSGDPLVNPVGLARAGVDLLVADPHARSIFQIDAKGKITVVVSSR